MMKINLIGNVVMLIVVEQSYIFGNEVYVVFVGVLWFFVVEGSLLYGFCCMCSFLVWFDVVLFDDLIEMKIC